MSQKCFNDIKWIETHANIFFGLHPRVLCTTIVQNSNYKSETQTFYSLFGVLGFLPCFSEPSPSPRPIKNAWLCCSVQLTWIGSSTLSTPVGKSILPEVTLKVLAGVDPSDRDVISQLTEASPDWPTWRSILKITNHDVTIMILCVKLNALKNTYYMISR